MSAAPTMKTGNQSPEKLRSFIERIEHLEDEKASMMADIKEVYSEAKGFGFDVSVMRQMVKMRAMDRQQLLERDALIETYRAALGLA